MTRHLQQLTVVVAVVVATGKAVLAVPPTPPEPPRTIDPRYPDYIVFPKVTCVEEGYFHHPRNCSWFYRCEDKMNISYFYTTYYECGPGTVFDDVLDVCVFPYLAGPPCGGKPSVVPRPTFPPTTDRTTQRPTPTPWTTTTLSTTTAVATSPQIPALPCVFDDNSCRAYEICRPNRETKILCSFGCRINGVLILLKDLCNDEDELFDEKRGQCVPKPRDNELCSATTPAPAPTVTIGSSNTLRCSEADTRPAEDWILSLYCDSYIICEEGGKFKEVQVLCRNFYQCNKRPDGSWTSEVRHCLGNLLYSYEEDRCLRVPSEDELC